MQRTLGVTGRLEVAYLATLRVVVLIVATLFVLGAAYFLVDGLRRLATSTTVAQAPVQVAAADVLAGVAVKKDAEDAPAAGRAGDAAGARAKFNAFLAGPFTRYHAQYVAIARRYNKPEDLLLTRGQLADSLGYTLEAYQKGEEPTIGLFVDDARYAAQIEAAAEALARDPRVGGQLQLYRSAQKTAQACHEVLTPRRGWDSTSTDCLNWYQSPIGCAVIRNVPEQRCEAAYPAGITSPAQAFQQMDSSFRGLWTEHAQAAAAAAQAEREKRQATKAGGGPSLIQAAQVFGGFLVVMFIFVVIAIERHLRRLAQLASAGDQPQRPLLQAAE